MKGAQCVSSCGRGHQSVWTEHPEDDARDDLALQCAGVRIAVEFTTAADRRLEGGPPGVERRGRSNTVAVPVVDGTGTGTDEEVGRCSDGTVPGGRAAAAQKKVVRGPPGQGGGPRTAGPDQ